MADTWTIALGCASTFEVDLVGSDGNPVVGLMSGDVPSALVWTGDDQPVVVGSAPTCYWQGGNPATTPTIMVAFSAANVAALGLPGRYVCRVGYTPVGGGDFLRAVNDIDLDVLPGPGSAAALLSYCTLRDMTLYAPWIEEIEALGRDLSGFARQRARARSWLDRLICTHERTDRFWRQADWSNDLLIPPTDTPVINPVGGGTTGGQLQPGTYLATYTLTSWQGETLASTESLPFTVQAGWIPSLSWATPPPGFNTASVYLTPEGPGSETLYLAGLTGTSALLATPFVPGGTAPPAGSPLGLSPAYLPSQSGAPTNPYGESPSDQRAIAENRMQRTWRMRAVQSWLNAGALMTDSTEGDLIREATARMAIALVCEGQLEAREKYEAKGQENRKLALSLVRSLRAPLDVNGDGLPEVVISCSNVWIA